MKLKKFFLPLLALCIVGCNSDDSEETTPVEIEIPTADFTVVGEDASNVYQYVFDGDAQIGEVENLTTDFSINTGYLTLRQTDDLLSFYYFEGGSFSLIIKNIRTGATARYSNFFANSEGRSVAWGINSEANVFFGFFGPSGTRNLGIQDVEFQTNVVEDTMIDSDIDFVYQPVLFNQKVYFAYLDNSGDFKFTFYDIETKSSGPILNFESIPISFLIGESGNIVIVKNGVEASLELFDADSLDLLETLPLMFNTAFTVGWVDGAVFDANVLYYAFPYAQPSEYPAGPASFDLGTQENNLVDFFAIADGVEEELGQPIGLTVQIYDPDQEVFLVGYEVLDQSARGGVLQISADGELIANVTTTFVPVYFVRN